MTGITGVHLWGRPCDIETLTAIAKRQGLTLLFDAAHALACSYRRQMIGAFGNAEVFSFDAEFLNTFEEGAVVTNDRALAAKTRLMRNFGFAGYDEIPCIGTNGKMSEASAAMELASLDCLDEFIAVNRSHCHRYLQGLTDIPGVSVVSYDEQERCHSRAPCGGSLSAVARTALPQHLGCTTGAAGTIRRYAAPL